MSTNQAEYKDKYEEDEEEEVEKKGWLRNACGGRREGISVVEDACYLAD